MAFKRDPPERSPVIRAPPMIPGNPPGRPPPRAVHFDDRPTYLESPPRGFRRGGGSPPHRHSEDASGRYAGGSPPQRYIEAAPPGYQDSPPLRFPGRRHHPPQYLSPEDSPPYRYIEDAPRRYVGGPSRPYSEDAPLPVDIDGPPPPGFRGEGARRFGGGIPSVGRPGYRNERPLRFSDSEESPSPPPGYFRPPPPPPGGVFVGEPRRFADSPRQFSRYGDDESPPHFAHEAPRRFGGPPRQFYDGSSPSPEYADEPPRRFAGTHEFHGDSPGYADEPPRRFAGSPPRRFADGSPPSPPGHRGHAENPANKFSGAPARRPHGPPSPRRSAGAHSPGPPGLEEDPPSRPHAGAPPARPHGRFPDDSPPGYAEDRPRERLAGPPRTFANESPPRRPGHAEDLPPGRRAGPPRTFADESPPRRPGYGEDPRHGRGAGPPRTFADESPPRRPGYAEDPRSERLAGAPRKYADGSPDYADEPPPGRSAGAPQRFTDDSPPRLPGYAEEPPPGRSAGAPQRFTAEDAPPRAIAGALPGHSSPPGPQRFVEGAPKAFTRTPPRQVPDGSPPGYNTPPGYDTPPGFGATPPRQFADGSAGYGGIPRPPPGAPVGVPPPGAPVGVPPPGVPVGAPPPGHSRLPPPPEIYSGGSTPSHYSPDVFATAAIAGPPPSGSAGASPIRYTAGQPLPLRSPDGSPPDIYGGPRPPDAPRAVGALGSTPPRFRGGRESGQDAYGGARLTPPREPYRPPPPGLGQGGGAPLLPPGFPTPPRVSSDGSAGLGSSPEMFYAGIPRRHPDGYTTRTPPRTRPLGNDAIFTANVVPIELDDKLKEVQPHQGNPGSQTGGGWKDLWAALVFVLQIAAIAALSIIFGLHGLTRTIQDFDEPNAFRITDWFPQLAAAAIVGAVFACIWQNAIRLAPVFMILVTIWTGATVMTLFGIVLISTGQSTGLIGLLFLFAGLCQGLYAFIVRTRVPFAGEILKKVISVCSRYPSTYAVSYIFVLVALGWLALWIFGLSGSGVRQRHVAIMAIFVVSLLWTMQVLRNIVRVTVAGTFALVYFQEGNMPRMPTSMSLMRACTTSLGSICFGSFFVPLIEAPCHALRRINAQAGASEFMFSCVVCLLSVFEHLIRYFNKMGYIQVAIYGKPFIRASKDTWDMLQAQAVDVLVHDDLSSTILFMACGIGGSLSALVGGIWTFIFHKSLTIAISLLSYLIGALMTYVTMGVLESGVATLYVCFAEDPASLQRHDGPFYERMWVRQMELVDPVNELSFNM